jgi:predicted PurR-regulated permease PerM
MLVKHPERLKCVMHRMPVFQDPDWCVSVFCVSFLHFCIFLILLTLFFLLLWTHLESMKQSLASLLVEATCPLDSNLEATLPSLHSRLSVMQTEMANGFALMKKWEAGVNSVMQESAQVVKQTQNVSQSVSQSVVQ